MRDTAHSTKRGIFKKAVMLKPKAVHPFTSADKETWKKALSGKPGQPFRIELSADSFASLRVASPMIRLDFPFVVPVL